MTLHAAVASEETLTVTGLRSVDGERPIPNDRWNAWLSDVGQIVEERIARDFDAERGAGKSLGSISDEHEQRKAREGLDLEKGHMYGDLQAELDAGGFASVTVASGTASISFDQEALYARAPHARYYAEQKVRGGKILVFLKRDGAAATKYLNARVAEWQRGEQTRTAGRRQMRRPSSLERVGGRLARTVLRAVFRV